MRLHSASVDTPGDIHQLTMQKQVITVLRQAGAVGPDPEVTAQYLAKRANRSWQPIVAGGKPASEMIVEERDSYTPRISEFL